MKTALLRTCLLCQSPEHKVVVSYDQPDSYEQAVGVEPEGYFRKWVECLQCGLYYSVYSRDENVIDKIYMTTYRNDKTAWRKTNTEEIFQKVIALPQQESETKFRVKWIKQHIEDFRTQGLLSASNPPYRLLDIGGATGVFAYEFQDHQWQSHVIDPGESGKFIQTKYNIPYVQDYYKSGQFQRTFNLISLVFVLEHFKDPMAILKALRADMAPGALLYIEVPDNICFRLKPAEDDIFNACHLWMFSPNTLTQLLDLCGFEVFCLQRVKTKRGYYSLMVLAGVKEHA